ncbi:MULTISPECIES: hypothetical protein [unclassified Duganella]|uniref:hypothetical protein n=1 Tax=unclassified Duganella TaxID=2636909 RepID=UPI0006F7ADA1|nr:MULTISPECIES: hypothetical protein [unclassified Duganella]KQV56384.1 hypothetical protein ASD07_27100 [Duganella sp. Root336D2]
MDSVVFGPDLALGIPVLDQSHRIVFDMLDAMAGLPRPAFDQACRELTMKKQAPATSSAPCRTGSKRTSTPWTWRWQLRYRA